jgi:hypothetical protein
MTPGKLKAHKDFGQGNKFKGSLKLLAAKHKQKSMWLPVSMHHKGSNHFLFRLLTQSQMKEKILLLGIVQTRRLNFLAS